MTILIVKNVKFCATPVAFIIREKSDGLDKCVNLKKAEPAENKVSTKTKTRTNLVQFIVKRGTKRRANIILPFIILTKIPTWSVRPDSKKDYHEHRR